jgi:hypothetical protein
MAVVTSAHPFALTQDKRGRGSVFRPTRSREQSLSPQRDGELPNLGGYVVNLDKRQLEGAPAYDVGEEPACGDRAYESKIHDYYGVGPYWAR